MKLGHRGNFVREANPSPKPSGFEDVNDMAFIESKRNGKPATWHNFFWYVQEGKPNSESWAARMNREKGT